MIQYKRTSSSTGGFSLSKPHTPSRAATSAPAPSGPPWAALGFVARTSDGQLLRPNAVAGRTTTITYKRPRRLVPAHA